jgi:hypothetical protein
MASQSQIDAAYGGKLFVLLYNLSHREVTLRPGDSLLRLELARLESPTDKPYSGAYQGQELKGVLKGHLRSSLTDMRETLKDANEKIAKAQESVRDAERDLSKTQGVAGIITALLVVVGAIGGAYQGTSITKLEKETEDIDQLRASQQSLQASQAALEAALTKKSDRIEVDALQKERDAIQATQHELRDLRRQLEELEEKLK